MSRTHMSGTELRDPLASSRSPVREDSSRAWIVFGAALSVRLVLAAVFLGGADGLNAISFMPNAARHDYIGIPYFPVVPSWLGFAGILDNGWLGWARTLHLHLTLVPPGLFPKLLPCLADSLVATWFALDTRRSARYRLVSSWTYAMCPLPLLLAAVQGQWDSLWMLFALPAITIATREDATARSRRLAGVLLGLGLLVKPVPIVLLPLLLPRYRDRLSLREWLRASQPIVVAFLATIALAFSWFAIEGFDLLRNLRYVLGYSTTGQGIVVFGLSHLSVLNHGGSSTGALRDVAIVIALAVIARYHLGSREADPMTTAAAVLLVLPAVGGIAPQYLLWPLPFMLAAGRLRTSAIYGSVSALAVGMYYAVGPERLFFVPIRWLRLLGFPVEAQRWLASSGPLATWNTFSDLVIPLLLLTTAVVLLRSGSQRSRTVVVGRGDHLGPGVALSLAVSSVLVVSTIVYALGPYRAVARRLIIHRIAQLHSYALGGFRSGYGLFVEPGSWWLSTLFLVPMLTVAWAVIVWRAARPLSSALGSRDDPRPAGVLTTGTAPG